VPEEVRTAVRNNAGRPLFAVQFPQRALANLGESLGVSKCGLE
jgi:hypothetical protein